MNKIKCPKCGEQIEIDQALKIQIQDESRVEIENALRKELEEKTNLEKKELKKIIEENEVKINSFREEELKLRGEKRRLEEKEKEMEVTTQRRIDEERKKIEELTLKKALEEHELKDREKEEKYRIALRQIEELKSKMQQGSMQIQGEVLELEVQDILTKEFPLDHISEVKKGQRGADVIQEVIDKLNRNCGKILWETKNAQWKNEWIAKLKEDQRQAKAILAVLVVENPPEGLVDFKFENGIWITTRKLVRSLASALRFDLIRVNQEKVNSIGKNEKMEVLYHYFTGVEFKQRIEAIVETFSNFQEEIEREKRWFAAKWSRQEKELRKVIDSTHGMYGDLQGISGNSLPQIKSLELESGEEKK